MKTKRFSKQILLSVKMESGETNWCFVKIGRRVSDRRLREVAEGRFGSDWVEIKMHDDEPPTVSPEAAKILEEFFGASHAQE